MGRQFSRSGAGLGEFASRFEFDGLKRHVVTDLDPVCVSAMAERFRHRPEVEARQIDVTKGTLDIGSAVSTVVAVNVLEHIEDDGAALRRLAKVVEPGGQIVLWVPAYQQLYGDFDRRIGHFRRYTPKTLRSVMLEAGLMPQYVRPVNLLGGIAWYFAVRRASVGSARPRLLRTYDRIVVPTTRLIERRITPPFGQSVIGVARVLQ